MKSVFNKIVFSVLLLVSTAANSSIIKYENMNGFDYVFGSYVYDDVTGKYSDVELYMNIEWIKGPWEMSITHIYQPTSIDGYLVGTTKASKEGSKYNTQIDFSASILIFNSTPGSVIVDSMYGFEYEYKDSDYTNQTINFVGYIGSDDPKIVTFKPYVLSSTVVPVPEPSTSMSFMFGIFSLILIGRNKYENTKDKKTKV